MKNDKQPENKTSYVPIGMCLGISIGMALGAAAGNIAIGMCMGIGVGMTIGSLVDHQNRKKDKNKSNEDDSE
jgi:hypothetical protein